MPRKRRRKGQQTAKTPDYPAKPSDELDSGETIDPSLAPINVQEVFADDEVNGDSAWGSQNPEEFFEKGPPPPGAPNIPEPPSSQPSEVGYQPPALVNVDFEGGDHLVVGPVTKPNVVDDRRIHLTWVVSEVSVRTQQKDGMVRPEIIVKAILCAAIYEMVPIAEQERKEPMLEVQPLMREPVELGIPLWLLPPGLVMNPDQISLAMAEKLMAQMFASFPTEIIKTPPKPAALEKIPDWLIKKLKEQKGPQQR
jgi:hypothetical protein